MLALPTWAGQKLPTTQTKENPWVGDINSPDFYWEAAYRGSRGMRDLVHGSDRKLHTHGADVSFVLGPDWPGDFNCNLRLGYDYGSRHWENGGRMSMQAFTLAPGFRYNLGCLDSGNLSAFVGANAGAAAQRLQCGGHDTAWGFAYTAELGVHYWLDAPSYEYYLFASCHISGNTARNRIAPLGGRHRLSHGFRVGFGCAF